MSIAPSRLSTAPLLLETRRAVAAGEQSAAAASAAADARVRAANGALHAFVHLPEVPAALPPAAIRGDAPLAGIAVAVKDVIDTADLPTGYGSRIDPTYLPPRDAWVVARLRSLGATVLGKTVTTEFAWRFPGPTVNPWQAAHTPGGSSSGSAAAVGAGLVPLALGTQTMGSVIRPAAYCGAVGFKPSYGAIGRTGMFPFALSLDHVGLFTRSVDDLDYVFGLLAGIDHEDRHGYLAADFPGPAVPVPAAIPDSAAASSGRAMRIGIVRTSRWNEVEPYQQALIEATGRRLAEAGAEVIEIPLPTAFDAAWSCAATILAAEAAAVHRERVLEYPTLVSPQLKELVADGARFGAIDYLDARATQASLKAAFERWLVAGHALDALLTTPATGEAPRGLDYTGDTTFCVPWTLLGVPAVTIPAGFGPNGLPLGVQFVGGYGRDRQLLALARWCERALGFSIGDPPSGA